MSNALTDRLIFAKGCISRALTEPGHGADYLKTAQAMFPGEFHRIKSTVPAVDSNDVNAATAPGAEVQEIIIKKSAFGGMLADMWRVSFQEPFSGAPLGLGSAWRSEYNPLPVTRSALTNYSLERLTVGGIQVWTLEALRASNAPVTYQRALEESCASDLDLALLDPVNGGVAGETPAGIASGAGVQKIAASTDPKDSFKHLLQNFNGNLRTTHIVMSSERAGRLALSGELAFADLGVNGGRIAGLNVITTQSMHTDSNGDAVIAVDASRIAVAWNEIEVRRSEAATIEMIDEFDSNAGEELVPLWQAESVALKAVQQVNWKLLDESCCRVLTGCDW